MQSVVEKPHNKYIILELKYKQHLAEYNVEFQAIKIKVLFMTQSL